MLSKAQIKLIRSLKHKKFRDKHNLFVVEGEKVAGELLLDAGNENSIYAVHSLYASSGWIRQNREILSGKFPVFEITMEDLEQISFLSTPRNVMMLIKIREMIFNPGFLQGKLTLVIDTVQDPGNLGTIIRIAHWYGIPNIICSMTSADLYNPKTIQATMGSFLSVRVFYTDLYGFLKDCYSTTSIPIYGTFLSGSNIYTCELASEGLIVLGNESKGISEELIPFIHTWLSIPAFPVQDKPDSLNVAQAAAIVCSEFRRRGL
ncbi:MAG: hypothetical protein AMS27_05315 [Bacteroides sp. SM23_62_1]|nr:MAG: hypothetical protein AMS27_05315 [Bacteroides sp. SM23_62_1]